MVKYTEDNIEGITFDNGVSKYTIASVNGNYLHLKEVNSSWEAKHYSSNSIIHNLNTNLYKVISQPSNIYELWI